MMRDFGELVVRFRGNALAVVAVIFLLFPGSASVLCIAPGGHVEIEALNATCCESSDIVSQNRNHQDDGISASGPCRNCIDLFMTPNSHGALLDSCNHAAPDLLAHPALPDRVLPIFSSARQPGTDRRAGALARAFSSAPLRC